MSCVLCCHQDQSNEYSTICSGLFYVGGCWGLTVAVVAVVAGGAAVVVAVVVVAAAADVAVVVGVAVVVVVVVVIVVVVVAVPPGLAGRAEVDARLRACDVGTVAAAPPDRRVAAAAGVPPPSLEPRVRLSRSSSRTKRWRAKAWLWLRPATSLSTALRRRRTTWALLLRRKKPTTRSATGSRAKATPLLAAAARSACQDLEMTE